MKKYNDILLQSPLFSGVNESDLTGMLRCLGAKVKKYAKNQSVFLEGEPATSIGILLSGGVQVIKED